MELREARRVDGGDCEMEVELEDLRLPTSEDNSYCYSPDILQDLQLSALTIPSPHTIRQCRLLRPKVTLNIGGSKHEVMWTLLETKPR